MRVKLLKSMNPNSASENIIGVNVLKGNGFLVAWNEEVIGVSLCVLLSGHQTRLFLS